MTNNQSKTIEKQLREAATKLGEAGIATPMLDARKLMAGAIATDLAGLIGKANNFPGEKETGRFDGYLRERLAGKPVYRILGEREFFGRLFSVADNVLDPRSETELLVERVLADWSGQKVHFAEIGIGSGAIAVSLLCELPQATAVVSDISAEAISASTANAKRHGVYDRLQIVKTDCLEGVDGKFDFIASNPPYINADEMGALPREVRDHDPHESLYGGEDGLDIYRKIFDCAGNHLSSNGKLYLETGHGQHSDLIKLATEKDWGLVSCHLDLSGLERIVVFSNRQERGDK